MLYMADCMLFLRAARSVATRRWSVPSTIANPGGACRPSRPRQLAGTSERAPGRQQQPIVFEITAGLRKPSPPVELRIARLVVRNRKVERTDERYPPRP